MAQGGRLYVVGDIHGCVHELETLLGALALGPDDTLAFIGDYVDRGPDSRAAVQLLLDVRRHGPKTVFLKGNHEDMCLGYLGRRGNWGEAWRMNGGGSTLRSYGIPTELAGAPAAERFPAEHLAFFESLLPWRKASDRVTELKAWVRVIVTAYVLTVVPLLLAMFTLMLINAPRIFATAWDSFFVQYHKVQDHLASVNGVIGILQMAILVLPALGIVVTFWRVGQRGTVSVWKQTEGHPAWRAVFVAASAAVAGFLGYLWWPNGEYRPIQKGEKGTVVGAVNELANISSGRPGLPAARARQLGGAPFRSNSTGTSNRTPQPASTNRTDTTTTPTQTTETSTSSSPTASTPTTDTATVPTTTASTTTTP